MGAWGSREVTTQTRDFALPVTKLFANFIFFGFWMGLLIHEHELAIWTYFDRYSLVRYGKGVYFLWFITSWYIVFTGVYLLVIEAILRPFLFTLVGYMRELQVELLIEVLYGLWVCGTVLGSWMDWERASNNCLYYNNCRSNFMNNFIGSVKGGCEYFLAYEKDYSWSGDSYRYQPDNVCNSIFTYCPTFMMTIISTGLSYLMLIILR